MEGKMKKKGKSKERNTSVKRKCVSFLAIQNISIAIIDKIIASQYHVYGAPLLLTVILWVGIFRKWRFFRDIYTVLAAIEFFIGIYTLIGSILYVAKGYDPTAGILQTVLGCSYAVSIFVLYKLKEEL